MQKSQHFLGNKQRSSSVGALPQERKHFTSRNESSTGISLDVRCACQYFQSDKLLPERDVIQNSIENFLFDQEKLDKQIQSENLDPTTRTQDMPHQKKLVVREIVSRKNSLTSNSIKSELGTRKGLFSSTELFSSNISNPSLDNLRILNSNRILCKVDIPRVEKQVESNELKISYFPENMYTVSQNKFNSQQNLSSSNDLYNAPSNTNTKHNDFSEKFRHRSRSPDGGAFQGRVLKQDSTKNISPPSNSNVETNSSTTKQINQNQYNLNTEAKQEMLQNQYNQNTEPKQEMLQEKNKFLANQTYLSPSPLQYSQQPINKKSNAQTLELNAMHYDEMQTNTNKKKSKKPAKPIKESQQIDRSKRNSFFQKDIRNLFQKPRRQKIKTPPKNSNFLKKLSTRCRFKASPNKNITTSKKISMSFEILPQESKIITMPVHLSGSEPKNLHSEFLVVNNIESNKNLSRKSSQHIDTTVFQSAVASVVQETFSLKVDELDQYAPKKNSNLLQMESKSKDHIQDGLISMPLLGPISDSDFNIPSKKYKNEFRENSYDEVIDNEAQKRHTFNSLNIKNPDNLGDKPLFESLISLPIWPANEPSVRIKETDTHSINKTFINNDSKVQVLQTSSERNVASVVSPNYNLRPKRNASKFSNKSIERDDSFTHTSFTLEKEENELGSQLIQSDHEYEPIGEVSIEVIEKSSQKQTDAPINDEKSVKYEDAKTAAKKVLIQLEKDLNKKYADEILPSSVESNQDELQTKKGIKDSPKSKYSYPFKLKIPKQFGKIGQKNRRVKKPIFEKSTQKPKSSIFKIFGGVKDFKNRKNQNRNGNGKKVAAKKRQVFKKFSSTTQKSTSSEENKKPKVQQLKKQDSIDKSRFSKINFSVPKFPSLSNTKGKFKKQPKSASTEDIAQNLNKSKFSISEFNNPLKKIEFNFATYPRAFKKRKNKTPVQIENDISSSNTDMQLKPPERVSKPERQKKDRVGGPVDSKWTDKFSDISGDKSSKTEKYSSYQNELQNYMSEISVESQPNTDDIMKNDIAISPVLDPNVKQFIDFDEENREIHAISINRQEEFNKRIPIIHQDSNISEDSSFIGWSEKEIAKNKLLRHGEVEGDSFDISYHSEERLTNNETQSTGSSTFKKGVIEEINDDEFFLRKRGISQDNIEIRQYISSAIRNGLDNSINDLEDVENFENDNNQLNYNNRYFIPIIPKRQKKGDIKNHENLNERNLKNSNTSVSDRYDEADFDNSFPNRPQRMNKKLNELSDTMYLFDDDIVKANSYQNETSQIKPVAPKRSKKKSTPIFFNDMEREHENAFHKYTQQQSDKEKGYPELNADHESHVDSLFRDMKNLDLESKFPPERPKRNYSTIIPKKFKKTTSSLESLEKKGHSSVNQYEELLIKTNDSYESDLQKSADNFGVKKMKNRPLPPPPRPYREKKNIVETFKNEDIPINNQTDMNVFKTHFEIDNATQTDPLPDDFVFEEFEITDDMKIIEPTVTRTLHDILQESATDNLDKSDTNLERGIQRFRESAQKSFSEKSKSSSKNESPIPGTTVSGELHLTQILALNKEKDPFDPLSTMKKIDSFENNNIDEDELCFDELDAAEDISKSTHDNIDSCDIDLNFFHETVEDDNKRNIIMEIQKLKREKDEEEKRMDIEKEDELQTLDNLNQNVPEKILIGDASEILDEIEKDINDEIFSQNFSDPEIHLEEDKLLDKPSIIPNIYPEESKFLVEEPSIKFSTEKFLVEESSIKSSTEKLYPDEDIEKKTALPTESKTHREAETNTEPENDRPSSKDETDSMDYIKRVTLPNIEIDCLKVHALQAGHIIVSKLSSNQITTEELECNSGTFTEDIILRGNTLKSSEKPVSVETQTQFDTQQNESSLSQSEVSSINTNRSNYNDIPSDAVRDGVLRYVPYHETLPSPPQPEVLRSTTERAHTDYSSDQDKSETEEPSAVQLGGQFIQVCGRSLLKQIAKMINTLNLHIQQDGRNNVGAIITLFLLMTFGFLIMTMSGRNIHHHHWDFFNLPNN